MVKFTEKELEKFKKQKMEEIDRWLDNEYGVSYTRLEELHDFVIEQDMKHQDEKGKEIERLNKGYCKFKGECGKYATCLRENQLKEIERLNNIIKQQNTRNSRQRIANRKLLERNQDLVIENLKLNNIINKIEEHFVFLKMNSTGGNKEFFEDILVFIKALKELKGSDKE